MTQASSARIIPGVCLSSLVVLLACPALLAQSGPARLGRGVEKLETGRYAEALQDLKAAQPLLPKLSDYVGYYLASADAELKDFAQVRKDLAPFRTLAAPSPLRGRAAILDARATTETSKRAILAQSNDESDGGTLSPDGSAARPETARRLRLSRNRIVRGVIIDVAP